MACITEPRVLEVLDGERAVVSTRGMRRVLIEPGSEVLAEFVGISQAKSMAAHFNDCWPSGKYRAIVVRYEARRQASPPLKSKRAAAARFRSAV